MKRHGSATSQEGSGDGASPARPTRKARKASGLGSGGMTPMRGKPVRKSYNRSERFK